EDLDGGDIVITEPAYFPEDTPEPSSEPEETPEPDASPSPTPTPSSTPGSQSSLKYMLEVDVTNQVITAYGQDSNGEYTKVVRRMICSTGKASTPTPLGT